MSKDWTERMTNPMMKDLIRKRLEAFIKGHSKEAVDLLVDDLFVLFRSGCALAIRAEYDKQNPREEEE